MVAVPAIKLRVSDPGPNSVGILAFEAAGAASRLLSLHRTLSNPSILLLRSQTLRSQGVAYLTSTDQLHLLRLAAAELILTLDFAAAFISRLSLLSSPRRRLPFLRLYSDLKSGSLDPHQLRLKFTAGSSIDKRIKKLERQIIITSKLYQEMELLNELEAANGRKKWGRFSGPIPMQKAGTSPVQEVSIKTQAQKVQKLKEKSLWSYSPEKAVGLMELTCYSIFARICVVFWPFVPGLPKVSVSKDNSRMFFSRLNQMTTTTTYRGSGPLMDRSGGGCGGAGTKDVAIRNSCPIVMNKEEVESVDWREMLTPGANTAGGAGLGLRYANIIVAAERVMMEGEAAGEEREDLYDMLPLKLKLAVRAKLKECWRDRGPVDVGLAGGWKDAVWRILGWLGPVAHDTVEWEAERSMDKLQRFEWGPKKLMAQTLHFSDKEKTEAAIVEVLVGLSLVCWYDEQRRSGRSYTYF